MTLRRQPVEGIHERQKVHPGTALGTVSGCFLQSFRGGRHCAESIFRINARRTSPGFTPDGILHPEKKADAKRKPAAQTGIKIDIYGKSV